MNRILTLFAVLLAAFAIFYVAATTPAAKSAAASASEFSAGRAMADIAVMARAPHPVGSPANAAVRDYLVKRMTALGLGPRVARAESHRVHTVGDADYVSGAIVENVVGVLPGRDRAAPALALMAHYDSVAGSPGAADDITGVADVLEIVRAIKAKGVAARDVVVLITDGEEAGLLGAHAFFDADPLAGRVGFVVNLESRGGGGRAAMFETGADDGAAIGLFARTAASPNANALTAFVYKLLPNDTDFSVARARGLRGLNYAFIGRQFDYHSPSSTVAALDQGSVQQMGDSALGPALALAVAPTLPGKAPDVVYSDVLGSIVVTYPIWGGWLVLMAAVGLAGLGWIRRAPGETVTWIGVVRGFGAALLVLAIAALLLALTRFVTGVGVGWSAYRPLLARFAPFEIAMAFAGVAGLLIVGGVMQRAGRSGRISETWIGVVASGFGAAIAVQVVAPTADFAIAWPLLAACACAALTGWGTRSEVLIARPALVISTLVSAWLGGLFHTLLQGLDMPEAPALVVGLAALSLWPLTRIDPREGRWGWAPAAACLATSLALAAWLNLSSPWTARHPAAAEPLYIVNETGQAWRAAPLPLAPWTRSVLLADGGAYQERSFAGLPGDFGAAHALPVPAKMPAVTVTVGRDGRVSLTAPFTPDAAMLFLDVKVNGPVTDVRLDGKPTAILTRPGGWTHLRWQAAPDGPTITFNAAGRRTLDYRYAMMLNRWPAEAKPLPAMPADVMAWDRSGATVLTGGHAVSW